MKRKYNPSEINLELAGLIPFVNKKYKGFTLYWNSDIGFGEYTIYKNRSGNKWYADSEHMDSNEDKAFIKELMNKFIEELEIVD